MKVFLITPEGEQGPLTAAQINRLHAQGKLKLDQMCRVEGSEGTKRVTDVFRHLAPKKDVVTAARKQVAVYNRNEGNSGVTTGTIMILAGIFCILFFNPLNIGFGLFIVGMTLIVRGQAQLRRAEKARQALHADDDRASWSSVIGKSDAASAAPTATSEESAENSRMDAPKLKPKGYDY
jgi:hypothetical protein